MSDTYVPKVYRDKGGDRQVIAPGGELQVLGTMSGFPPTTDYYVDASVSATGDGTSWQEAYLTISEAMTAAAALGTRGRARVFVAPGGYNEDVVTPLNTECPFGQLVAVNATPGRSYGGAYIYASTASTPTLIVRARGWLIQGFEIGAVANAGAIWLDGSTANSNAGGTELRNNIISGWGAASTYGIDVTGNGAPHTQVYDNHFNGCVEAAIKCSESGTDQPRFWEIAGNHFVDNGQHIGMNPRGFKESWIHHNVFLEVGANRTATEQLDNRGGSACAIGPGNFLSDTYDTAGGYRPGSDEDWYGNASEDGYTTANPTT